MIRDESRYGTGRLWMSRTWKWDGALENGWFAHWDGDDSCSAPNRLPGGLRRS
jgi:hypothetical protein